MQTFKWLLKREFWENRGMLIWSNSIVSGLMIVFCLFVAFKSHDLYDSFTVIGGTPGKAQLDGIASRIVSGSSAISMMLFGIVMIFPIYSYALGALSEERQDRSILFWKSLPISDEKTVLAKLAFAIVAFPVATILYSILTNLICLLIICIGYAFHGVNLFVEVLLHPDVWKPAYKLAFNWPVYFAWSLPTIGWLLLMSSILNRRVGLWAVLCPIALCLLIVWADRQLEMDLNLRSIAYFLVGRLLFSLIPFGWLWNSEVIRPTSRETLNVVLQSVGGEHWLQFQHWNIWAGVVVGACMIFAAIKIRRWRE